jgi:hypothetical protein
MTSSPITRSFMATSIHADTSCQLPHIARSEPRRSMSGSRRRALGSRRDRQGNLPLGPASPSEVNVTMSANALMSRATKFSTLKRWAMDVAKRRGMRRAKVALARKLATVLHRIWVDGTEFVWGKDPAATVAT